MKRKILIVKDDIQSIYMLIFLLESNNYEVFQSNHGIDGILKAKLLKPDAIILDIQLPEMDGYKITKELIFDSNLKNIPIIVVTSFAMIGDKNKALDAVATGYIEKPVNHYTFINQMEDFILNFQFNK